MTSNPDSRPGAVPRSDAQPPPGQSPRPVREGPHTGPQPRYGDWMQTYTGRQFWPLDPRDEELDIRDIAHALSHTCRYNGHVDRFYSVAEHSVLLSTVVSAENQLWALMHDAAEAYIGDMVRPLKRFMHKFQETENHLLHAIARKFNLPNQTMSKAGIIPPEVVTADTRILLNERAILMKAPPADWNLGKLKRLPGVEIIGWHPRHAEHMFLQRFEELGGEV